ncbi:unnamed protein product [Ectocarpus sp. 8 AP-2014]
MPRKKTNVESGRKKYGRGEEEGGVGDGVTGPSCSGRMPHLESHARVSSSTREGYVPEEGHSWNGTIRSSSSRHGGHQKPNDVSGEQRSLHGLSRGAMLGTAIFHQKDKSGVETGPDGAVPYNCAPPVQPLERGAV